MANEFDFQSGWTFVIAFLMPSTHEEPKEIYNWMLRFFLYSLKKNLKNILKD